MPAPTEHDIARAAARPVVLGCLSGVHTAEQVGEFLADAEDKWEDLLDDDSGNAGSGKKSKAYVQCPARPHLWRAAKHCVF